MTNLREIIFRKGVLTFVKSKRWKEGDKRKNSFLILTPSNSGSLGDEAIVTVIVRTLANQNPTPRITLFIWNGDEYEQFRDLHVVTQVVGKFLKNPLGVRSVATLYSITRKVVNAVNNSTHLIIPGTDVLDGSYSEIRSLRRILICEIAYMRGLAASIIGFSFSDNATPSTREAMARLPSRVRLAARDPVSGERLRAICKRNVDVTADLAFLLEPSRPVSPHCDELIARIDRERSNGVRIIAVNINRQAFGPEGDKYPNRVVEAYWAVLRAMHTQGKFLFLLIPHDYRGEHSDEALHRRLLEKSGGELDVQAPSGRLSAEEAKYLVSLADLTITGRMHLGIASISMRVPAMIHDYQGKVEGLFSLFSLKNLRISTTEFDDPKQLCSRIINTLNEKDELANEIATRLEEVKGLARKNLPFENDNTEEVHLRGERD